MTIVVGTLASSSRGNVIKKIDFNDDSSLLESDAIIN
jgi:hypothetical protein